MSFEINLIITSIIIGGLFFGFYQAGKHKVFEKWLNENKSKKTN